MKIKTRFGRIIESPPIRISTNRKAKIDSRRAWEWMLEETKKEWVNREPFILQLLNGINVKNISESDCEMLFDLLLPDGHTQYIFELKG